MRMIDADSMKADLLTVDPRYEGMIQWCITVLDAQPTIEERKTGRWAWSEADASWCCEACGCVFEEIEWKPEYNYCPNCGADMRGEGHE